MAIRLKSAVFCEAIKQSGVGRRTKPIRPREVITLGVVDEMFLVLTLRGSVGRYDVRIFRFDPGSPPRAERYRIELDGFHDDELVLHFENLRVGFYRVDVFVHDAGAGVALLGSPALEVRAQ